MAGVDLRAVQELGGWKSLRMVERYGHLAPDHLRAAGKPRPSCTTLWLHFSPHKRGGMVRKCLMRL